MEENLDVKTQAMKLPTTEVNFHVKCDKTSVGDRVALVGSIKELGEWNTEKALFLETSPDTYPMWNIKLILPKNCIIEYKYLIIKFAMVPSQAQGGQVQTIPISEVWENLGSSTANRRLNTFDKKEMNLTDEMNSKVVIEEYVEDRSQIPPN